MQPGVNIDSHDVTPITCFSEEWDLPEWVISIQHDRTTPIDCFPLPFEETIEATKGFPDVDTDVLSFASSGSPECCHRDGLGSQADRGHSAEAMGAGDNRIGAVEAELAAAIGSRHADIGEDLI